MCVNLVGNNLSELIKKWVIKTHFLHLIITYNIKYAFRKLIKHSVSQFD